jgi:hypothetical protein
MMKLQLVILVFVMLCHLTLSFRQTNLKFHLRHSLGQTIISKPLSSTLSNNNVWEAAGPNFHSSVCAATTKAINIVFPSNF